MSDFASTLAAKSSQTSRNGGKNRQYKYLAFLSIIKNIYYLNRLALFIVCAG